MDEAINRRRFPRLKAPVFFKSKRLFAPKVPVVDIGLGGLRVYSDDKFKVGQVIDIELYLPSRDILACTVRVAWQRELAPTDPARYDVGLQIVDVKGDRLHLLAQALESATTAAG